MDPVVAGVLDASYLAPDCFHISGRGHQISGIGAWQNLLAPEAEKVRTFAPVDGNGANQIPCPSAARSVPHHVHLCRASLRQSLPLLTFVLRNRACGAISLLCSFVWHCVPCALASGLRQPTVACGVSTLHFGCKCWKLARTDTSANPNRHEPGGIGHISTQGGTMAAAGSERQKPLLHHPLPYQL
jgi:hypothetical protein